MPLLIPPPPAQPVRGDKRRLLACALAAALLLAGVAMWAALRPDAYGAPRAGCVTVTIPSTTGGALLHRCGSQAREMCKGAFARHDRLAMLTRPPCRAAGLG